MTRFEGVTVPVTVEIPLDQYPDLASHAEVLGYETVGQLLLGIASKFRGDFIADTVAVLHRQGMCDADIAAALHVTNAAVAYRRKKLGLPPNPRYRRTA